MPETKINKFDMIKMKKIATYDFELLLRNIIPANSSYKCVTLTWLHYVSTYVNIKSQITFFSLNYLGQWNCDIWFS